LSRSKTICSIPRTWTREDYRAHSCDDGSHFHKSPSSVYIQEKKGLVVWLMKLGVDGGDCDVIYELPEAHPGPATKSYCSPDPINTGLSYAVGEELAMDFYDGQEYAPVLLAHIRMKRENPAPERTAALCYEIQP
jgi:hypothetical protein